MKSWSSPLEGARPRAEAGATTYSVSCQIQQNKRSPECSFWHYNRSNTWIVKPFRQVRLMFLLGDWTNIKHILRVWVRPNTKNTKNMKNICISELFEEEGVQPRVPENYHVFGMLVFLSSFCRGQVSSQESLKIDISGLVAFSAKNLDNTKKIKIIKKKSADVDPEQPLGGLLGFTSVDCCRVVSKDSCAAMHIDYCSLMSIGLVFFHACRFVQYHEHRLTRFHICTLFRCHVHKFCFASCLQICAVMSIDFRSCYFTTPCPPLLLGKYYLVLLRFQKG